jgi:hypothetical protein
MSLSYFFGKKEQEQESTSDSSPPKNKPDSPDEPKESSPTDLALARKTSLSQEVRVLPVVNIQDSQCHHLMTYVPVAGFLNDRVRHVAAGLEFDQAHHEQQLKSKDILLKICDKQDQLKEHA